MCPGLRDSLIADECARTANDHCTDDRQETEERPGMCKRWPFEEASGVEKRQTNASQGPCQANAERQDQ